MSVELRPLGINCNISCQYCYQNPQRDAANPSGKYDLEKMKSSLQQEGTDFAIFGGEPLLLPENDLEHLWTWGLEKFGSNGIQTNGTLINDNHIRMFKDYKVKVGISIDGPNSLNDARWAGTLQKTREQTNKIEIIIERLLDEGIVPSLIVTLHRNNATPDKIPLMHSWLKRLDQRGVKSVRLHILEVEDLSIQKKYALTQLENIEALLSFAKLEKELINIKLDIFRDMEGMLLANDTYCSCVWRACDPYTTKAVRGVKGEGQRSNCGRTNKDGIDFIKSDSEGYERYLALYYTPQEYNGCKGCRFFLMCKGQCPGTAIDGDWRNKTEHCSIWMELFEQLEQNLKRQNKNPISLDPNLRYLEENMIASWQAGVNPTLKEKLNQMNSAYKAQQIHH